MAYLITQMAVTLLLAMIAGGALGWLLHRRIGNSNNAVLEAELERVQLQVRQAQSDVAVLADDYDDLKQRSQDEISRLKIDADKLPDYAHRLEESQQVVRKLMQQHEQQLRELGAENETLRRQAKQLADRERQLQQLQAGLDARQRALRNERKDDNGGMGAAAGLGGAAALAGATVKAATGNTVDSATAERADAESLAAEQTIALDAGASGENEADELMELSAELQAELAEVEEHVSADGAEDEDEDDSDADGELDEGADTDALDDSLDASLDDSIGDDSLDEIDMEDVAALEDEFEADDAEAFESEDALVDDAGSLTIALAEADKVMASLDKGRAVKKAAAANPPAAKKKTAAKRSKAKQDLLFDPVDQHDDLQQIFGIGPVTEQGLNKLGITSYSQLAELKRHDIQKIAQALRIVPDKIERDDWVGNARRQLQDVLEEL